MTISYYIHAWQGLLMFCAGIVSVLASFGGYLQSGGGEELLRNALANLETGRAQFDKVTLNWRTGEMVVKNLRHDDYVPWKQDPDTHFKNLIAQEVRVKMDLLPWPPNVRSITVRGMPQAEVNVSSGFLQSGKLVSPRGPRYPIDFVDCNVQVKVGDVPALKLTGCNGELRRGANGDLRGAFSLHQLNDQPFNFRLETVEDGGWLFTGGEIQLDTQKTLATNTTPFVTKFDPVGLLLRALFSGEMAARGTLSSLKVSVQPAQGIVDGEVAFKGLEFNLPPAEKQTGEALPFFLGQLLGGSKQKDGKEEPIWPRWLQVDQIRAGDNGRVTFHMANNRLNFSTDEGTGSSLLFSRAGKAFPALESLKGSVETDPDGHATRILLRGFLGDQFEFESRMDRAVDRSRTYELVLAPRTGDSRRIAFGTPLWRVATRLKDYYSVEEPQRKNLPLVEFEIEGDARHFPRPDLLPLGMQDLSGHVYAKGHVTDWLLLKIENIRIDDGSALLYGGPDVASSGRDFGPPSRGVRAIFGTGSPWRLQDVELQGQAEAQFSQDFTLEYTLLRNWRMTSGSLMHAGLTTDIGLAQLTVNGKHSQHPSKDSVTLIELAAESKGPWQVKWNGEWERKSGSPSTGTFTLNEENVPLLLHPQREHLEPRFISEDKRRVNRRTTVFIEGDKVSRDIKP